MLIGVDIQSGNRCLARSIADAGFAEFRRQLEYKSAMTGARVVVIDRFFPSSKTCHSCGTIHDMKLSERTMVCECGHEMDRDLNAAMNIRRQALALLPVEEKALAVAQATTKPVPLKQEIAGLHSNVQTL